MTEPGSELAVFEPPVIPAHPKDRADLLGAWIKEHRGYLMSTSSSASPKRATRTMSSSRRSRS